KREEDAARVLENSVELNPQDIQALSTLALTYDNLKRYADSDRIYEQALKLDPNNHLILNNYGYSLADRGIQLERALKMAKEAVRQQPENSSYLDTLGWVYFKLGEYEKARRYITEAIEAGDTSAVIHEHLGDVYWKLNKPDKALEYWQKAYELDSSNQALKEKIERGRL
ncbi:MAG: tetratricopeptide repeat protein, partial [Bacteroidota bacterium]